MGDKSTWINDSRQELHQKRPYNTIPTVDSPQGAWLVVDDRRTLNFCSNNYLGLANDPRLVEAVKDAAAGPGVGGSIAGTQMLHVEFENRLAAFKETEAAIALQSGFTTNLTVIPALVGPDDAIFSDELNHAGIIDGCRMSGAQIIRYPHNDPATLRKLLTDKRRNFDQAMIITDGVFSMDGDIAPLPELVNLADKYECLMMVDDAHGEGVMGHGGRGIVHHFGLQGRVEVEVGTMSKAFGVVGGYVAGKASIVERLRRHGWPFLFSSAMTVPDTAACLAAVNMLAESPELVDHLWQNTRYFQEKMQTLGFDIGRTVTPITPIMLKQEQLTQEFSRRLFEEGLVAIAIAYPTVPFGQARIRVTISASHSQNDLDYGADVFARVGRELGVV